MVNSAAKIQKQLLVTMTVTTSCPGTTEYMVYANIIKKMYASKYLLKGKHQNYNQYFLCNFGLCQGHI